MATFKGNGALTGMVGNLVIANYKSGKSVLRKSPRERKYSDKQKQNWQRFSAVTALWKSFHGSPVQEIWKIAVEGRRGINLFINANSSAFNPEGELVDPERLHFSAGKLPLPHQIKAARSAADPGKVEVTWQDDPGSSLTRSNDELMMMIAHDGNFMGPIATGATRKQESALIQLPALSGTVQGIYLSFASEKRKLYSGDVYFKI